MAIKGLKTPTKKNIKGKEEINVKETFISSNEVAKTYEKTTLNLDKDLKKKAKQYVIENDIKTLGILVEIALKKYMED